MSILYPELLQNPEEYDKAESFLHKELLQVFAENAEWKTPWINNTFADGTPSRDGNPIFSAVCPAHKLGIRLIVHEPTGNAGELAVWTDVFAKGEPEEVNELVISTVLTTETLQECLNLIRQWVDRQEIRVST